MLTSIVHSCVSAGYTPWSLIEAAEARGIRLKSNPNSLVARWKQVGGGQHQHQHQPLRPSTASPSQHLQQQQHQQGLEDSWAGRASPPPSSTRPAHPYHLRHPPQHHSAAVTLNVGPQQGSELGGLDLGLDLGIDLALSGSASEEDLYLQEMEDGAQQGAEWLLPHPEALAQSSASNCRV
jgi:hypothetical protein